MADLLVRGLDEALVQALKKRAGAHGVSPPRRSLAEVLSAMPDVGEVADFERRTDRERADDVVG